MDFIQVASFSSRIEAETVAHALDPFDIPFILKGDDVGLFGTGQSLHVPGGVTLWIPESRLKEVARLLDCVVMPDAETGDFVP